MALSIIFLWLLALHTETYWASPEPSFPVRDSENNPCWGCLGLACETSSCHFEKYKIAGDVDIGHDSATKLIIAKISEHTVPCTYLFFFPYLLYIAELEVP